jgi:hypothetical protein
MSKNYLGFQSKLFKVSTCLNCLRFKRPLKDATRKKADKRKKNLETQN